MWLQRLHNLVAAKQPAQLCLVGCATTLQWLHATRTPAVASGSFLDCLDYGACDRGKALVNALSNDSIA